MCPQFQPCRWRGGLLIARSAASNAQWLARLGQPRAPTWECVKYEEACREAAVSTAAATTAATAAHRSTVGGPYRSPFCSHRSAGGVAGRRAWLACPPLAYSAAWYLARRGVRWYGRGYGRGARPLPPSAQRVGAFRLRDGVPGRGEGGTRGDAARTRSPASARRRTCSARGHVSSVTASLRCIFATDASELGCSRAAVGCSSRVLDVSGGRRGTVAGVPPAYGERLACIAYAAERGRVAPPQLLARGDRRPAPSRGALLY